MNNGTQKKSLQGGWSDSLGSDLICSLLVEISLDFAVGGSFGCGNCGGTHWSIPLSREVSSTVPPVPFQVVPGINTCTWQTPEKASSSESDQSFSIPLMLCNSRWKHVCVSTRNLQYATLISWLQGTSQASVTKRPKPSHRQVQTNFDTMKSIFGARSLWLYDN